MAYEEYANESEGMFELEFLKTTITCIFTR